MTASNYAPRLQASLKVQAELLAAEEGTTLNQFINVAVAEKIAPLKNTQGGYCALRICSMAFVTRCVLLGGL